MSVVTSELKEMATAMSSRETSIARLRRSEARLSRQVTEQREYIPGAAGKAHGHSP